jgi:hypothetical protein
MAENRDFPCRSPARCNPPQAEARRSGPARRIDLDRLVWDQEYREEVRFYLKSTDVEA